MARVYYYQSRDKKPLAATALLVRALVKEGFSETPLIRKNPYGKPVIVRPEGVFGNGSHSGSLTVAALSDREIGIDVQACTEDRDFLALAQRFMHPAEYQMLKQLPPGELKPGFYQLWAQKESYQKYRGLGFHLPMNAFYIQEEHTVYSVYEQGKRQPVHLEPVSVEQGYVCWLCEKEKEQYLWKKSVCIHLPTD